MPIMQQSDTYVDAPLTNVAINYVNSNQEYVADKVFPVVPTEKQSGKYFKFDAADLLRIDVKKKAAGGPVPRSGWTVSTDTYSAEVRAIGNEIHDQTRATADPTIDLDKNSVAFVMGQILRNRDVDFANTFMATGIWGTDYTGVANADNDTAAEVTKWNDYTNSDPVGDIDLARDTIHKATGFKPNKLVLAKDVYNVLKGHPDIIDRIKYTGSNDNPARVNKNTLAALFEVEELLVIDTVYNTAAEGVTAAGSFLAAGKALLVYAPANASVDLPSAGYTFSWSGFVGSNNTGVRVRNYRQPEEFESDMVEGQAAYDMKVTGSALGALFASLV